MRGLRFLRGGEWSCCLTRSLIGTAALSRSDFSSGVWRELGQGFIIMQPVLTTFQVIRVDYQSHFFFFCGIKAPNLSWSLSFFKPELSYYSCFVTVVFSWAERVTLYHSCIGTSVGIKKYNFGAWLLEWNHIKLKVAPCLSSVAKKPCHHQNLLPGMWGWTLLWDSFLAQYVLWAF